MCLCLTPAEYSAGFLCMTVTVLQGLYESDVVGTRVQCCPELFNVLTITIGLPAVEVLKNSSDWIGISATVVAVDEYGLTLFHMTIKKQNQKEKKENKQTPAFDF